MQDLEVSCQDLKSRLEAGESIRLVDCREPWEHERVRLVGSQLIPVSDTPARLNDYCDAEGPTVIYCHHGIRSLHVVKWLREHGMEDVQSLSGGIDAWSQLIDPGLPRY